MRRFVTKSLSLLLGALVSTSVHAQDAEEVPCEYGPEPSYRVVEPDPDAEPWPSPPRDEARRSALMGFPVRGRVVQAGTGAPLQGIEVTLDGETLLTAADGAFAFELPVIVGHEVELVFQARDIDGKDGGGKHKSAKLSVKVIDGALPEAIEAQGVLLELEPR